MNNTCFLYCRSSNHSQFSCGALEQHERLLRDVAAANGLTVVGVSKVEENGVIPNRESIRDMINRVNAQKIGTVIVMQRDQLCHDAFGFSQIIKALHQVGANVLYGIEPSINSKGDNNYLLEDGGVNGSC